MYIFIKWWGHYVKTPLFTCNKVEKIFFCFMWSWFKSLWRNGTADLLYLSVWALLTMNLSGFLVLIVWIPACFGKKLEKFSFLTDFFANFKAFFSLLSWRLSNLRNFSDLEYPSYLFPIISLTAAFWILSMSLESDFVKLLCQTDL